MSKFRSRSFESNSVKITFVNRMHPDCGSSGGGGVGDGGKRQYVAATWPQRVYYIVAMQSGWVAVSVRSPVVAVQLDTTKKTVCNVFGFCLDPTINPKFSTKPSLRKLRFLSFQSFWIIACRKKSYKPLWVAVLPKPDFVLYIQTTDELTF